MGMPMRWSPIFWQRGSGPALSCRRTLATLSRRRLTPRSSRAPTAKRQGRATVQVCFYCRAALAFYCRCRLSSNVRQRSGSSRVDRSSLEGRPCCHLPPGCRSQGHRRQVPRSPCALRPQPKTNTEYGGRGPELWVGQFVVPPPHALVPLRHGWRGAAQIQSARLSRPRPAPCPRAPESKPWSSGAVIAWQAEKCAA